MPIIRVEMIEGRSAEQKQALSQALTDAFVQTCQGKAESVYVVIEDVKKENWAIAGKLVSQRSES
ncbi:MAG: 4-oxalocrotonate tautomerase [Gammaproteobacteria bacterium]|nr:4-oxalocrotonate tautomerase [Gammaproteobacteria bacterium]